MSLLFDVFSERRVPKVVIMLYNALQTVAGLLGYNLNMQRSE